jgi:hypothetical protein
MRQHARVFPAATLPDVRIEKEALLAFSVSLLCFDSEHLHV